MGKIITIGKTVGHPARLTGAAPRSITAAFPGLSQLPCVHAMGPMIFDPIWSQKKHLSRGHCELIHVISGNVRVEVPRGCLAGRPGDTLLIPSDTLHRDNFDIAAGLKVFMAHFSWVAERDYFALVKPMSLPIANARVAEDIVRLIDRLHAGLNYGTEADRLLVCSQVHAILLMILRETLRKGSRHKVEAKKAYGERHRRLLMLRARQYLDEHFAEPVSLEQMARLLNVSPFYLSHVFSRESDFSLFAYLTNLRMQKARAILQAGTSNVTEVAHTVGYEDEGYFSKVFRKHFGFPPRDLRD